MSELSTMQGAALERTPQRIGEEIRSLTYQAKCMTVYFGVEIGRRLVEAKELVGHGGWGNFVQNETEFSQATASRFMKVFEAYGADQIGIFGAEAKSSTLQNLSISNALRLLAVPEEERENFALAVDAEHISARELEKVIRERDEARASEKTAEESRAKMEQDMAMLKQLHEAAARGEEKARAELDRVKRELAELREKPVEVAVEVKDAARNSWPGPGRRPVRPPNRSGGKSCRRRKRSCLMRRRRKRRWRTEWQSCKRRQNPGTVCPGRWNG